jgi:UDP-N-acetylmuramoyl-tripeptide--D-alanyl-D-alanine ligase
MTPEVDTFLRDRKALRAGGHGAAFERVCTDSRTLKAGDLFVALKGDAFDGHQFVLGARKAGAAGAVVSREWATGQDRAALTASGFCLWMVDDTLLALGDIARGHLRRLGVRRGALTGSNGKTTTKEFVASILKVHFGEPAVLFTQGNLNNQVGVPLTAFRAVEAHQVALFEMGMNHAGEIAALCRIAEPQTTLITNVGPAHIGNFDGKIEGIAAAKGEIFQGTVEGGTICVNVDDPLVADQAARAPQHRQKVTFGRHADAQWRLMREEQVGAAQRLVLVNKGQELTVDLQALGAHNALNACAAATLASEMGASHASIVAGLSGAQPVGGRGVQRRSTSGATVVDDSYNANPASVIASINLARALAQGRRLVLVLGDMLELGARELELHAQVGAHAASVHPDVLMVAGTRSRATAEGALKAGLTSSSVKHAEKLEDLLAALTAEVRQGDVVLVKGSRGSRMERAVVALCGTSAEGGH